MMELGKFNIIRRVLPYILLLCIYSISPSLGLAFNPEKNSHSANTKYVFKNSKKTNPSARNKHLILVVGDSASLNPSEQQLLSRLTGRGYNINIINDDAEVPGAGDSIDLIIVSKTVNSLNIGTRFKNMTCGFLTWEDNLQMGQLMGYSDNDGSQGTAWHSKHQNWTVVTDSPAALHAGIVGNVEIYSTVDEMTYSPNNSQVPKSAIIVAELFPGDSHKTYYVFEKGARLGDGSKAKGRRVYFGLYDDTFKHLNHNGLKLFDAAVEWAIKKP